MTIDIIKINRVEPNPVGPDYRSKLNEEWIEIKNSGYSSENLSGWKIWHRAQPKGNFLKAYEFSRFVLDSGMAVKVHTGSATDTTTDLFMGRGNFIWNNTGDEAQLDNAEGKTVSTMVVPPTDR